MLTDRFAIVAEGPDGLAGWPVAVAAARAGEIGIVDGGWEDAPGPIRVLLDRLPDGVVGSLGVRLDGDRPDVWRSLVPRLAKRFGAVVLTFPSNAAGLAGLVEPLRDAGLSLLLEVVSLAEATAAARCGAHAVIVKGNESGGRVSDLTTFVLAQQVVPAVHVPVLAQGGIGLHTAAACAAAGAAGVVLDWQLALLRESPLSEGARERLSHLDGSEPVCVGRSLGEPHRVYVPRGSSTVELLGAQEARLRGRPDATAAWRACVARAVRDDRREGVWPAGQDLAFGARLAGRFRTVAGVVHALREAVPRHLRIARESIPLGEGRGSSTAMRTRYPIVQGPMSRTTDVPEFAAAVAENGALPLMAVALMSADELDTMLRRTAELVGDRPWGVGLLGFIPPERYAEQVELVRKYRPPIALIAGGRPAQAAALSAAGIQAYVHVPSAGLLDLFVAEGIRRCVFEGRECGGHVGRYSSFVLWDSAIDVLLERVPHGEENEYDIWFAGGISTATSSAMVAAMAAPLAERGIRFGVLMGSAYLFTAEAVRHGAIAPGFQRRVLDAQRTDVLDSGGGYEVRTAPCRFTGAFEREKARLEDEGKPAEEVRMALELLNLGRLRIAAKGIRFNAASLKDPTLPALLQVDADEQEKEGLFMAGDAIALNDRVVSVAELHRRVSVEGMERLGASPAPAPEVVDTPARRDGACEIAIVGMSALFAGARDLEAFWENIVNKVDAVREIPPERWDWRRYFDADPAARDKIYSRWGGFLEPVVFDPTRYGIPPAAVRVVDPIQLLALQTAGQALRDAGLDQRPFDREHTAVVFGVAGGMGDWGLQYGFRSMLPLFFERPPEELLAQLPEWTEDSFPGLLANVVAGRIANTFDLGGPNFTVDAACASGLAAIYAAVGELLDGRVNVALAGAVDVTQNPFGYLCFSKSRALSGNGRSRPFDASADGIAIGEGVAAVVLKRRADADRDGDRIYAVIRGVGSASDGRGKSLTAPQAAGQLRAVKTAYEQAGYSLDQVGLLEAHGTGTVLGDATEAGSMDEALRAAGAAPRRCAVGSVKSMIGHTKGCAGLAGLIKAALALHHRVLPPTLGVEAPSPSLLRDDRCPLYVNTEARPWIAGETPRRAGVNAFGFGGTNFHVALEEHSGQGSPSFPLTTWPSELFLWRGEGPQALRAQIESLSRTLATSSGRPPSLAELASAVHRVQRGAPRGVTLAIVAESVADLREKLERAAAALASGAAQVRDPRGVFFSAGPLAREAGRVAFVFPGQGAQRPDMLRDLTLAFDEMCERYEVADRVLASRLPRPLSQFVFPPPRFDAAEEERYLAELTVTNRAQPALAVVGMGLCEVLERLGVRPAMAAGHSSGEYVALCAAGVFDETALYEVLESRGASILESSDGDLGTMAAVSASAEEVRAALGDEPGVHLANFNAPDQIVLSGARADLDRTAVRLRALGLRVTAVQVACGFHSPLMQPARDRLAAKLATLEYRAPAIPVFANSLADRYPEARERIQAILTDHLTQPVRFTEEIQAMYAAGARVFVELGPGSTCTGLVKRILEGRDHLAVALDTRGARHGLSVLLAALAQLAAEGLPVDASVLFERRALEALDLATLRPLAAEREFSPASVMLAPDRCWPIAEARPTVRPVAALAHGDAPVLASAASLPSARAVPAAAAEVFARHQQLMADFLERHREIMLAYLGAAPATAEPSSLGALATATPPVAAPSAAAAPPGPAPAASPPTSAASASVASNLHDQLIGLVAKRTGYPREMLALGLDMEADLGIDSIKRVEIVTAFAKLVPGAAPDLAERLRSVRTLGQVLELAPAAAAEPSPPGASPRGAGSLHGKLIELVAKRTGYPPEMLSLRLDMEADLGIDSIKRVEILTAFAKVVPGASADLGERLRAMRTLGQVLEAVGEGSAAPEPASAPAPAADWETILIELISKRTGYPFESVRANRALDLERDLGIDSIKRVEILTAFASTLPGASPDGAERLRNAVAEQLRGARTVAAMLEVVKPYVTSSPPPAAGAAVATDSPDTVPASPLRRLLVRMSSAPVADAGSPTPPTGVIVVSSDGDLGAQVARRILDLGGRAVVLSADLDLGDAATVTDALQRVRAERGSIGGVLHLLPMRATPPWPDITETAWRSHAAQEVKGLFHLLRAAAPDLGRERRPWIVSASRSCTGPVDGLLPVLEQPWRGGLIGLVKSAAAEWPAALCRAIDLDAADPAEAARALLLELATDDDAREVYLHGGRRSVPRLVAAPSASAPTARRAFDPREVVLVVGRERGITAQVAVELARRFQPRLVLCGRSPWPSEPEPDSTASALDGGELKRRLYDDARRAGVTPSPRELEATALRLLREREMRRTLELIRSHGAAVEYHAVDAQDPRALRELIEQVRAEHGRITGVIDGAGVIEDRLIEDKSPESWSRVFDLKADSAFHLARELASDPPDFLVLFSSIAGWYGNRGQSDYAAANEVLNRLALRLGEDWRTRVVAVNWGPWGGTGMVTDAVRESFRSRGIGLIEPTLGRSWMVDALLGDEPSEAVVIVQAEPG